MRRPLGAFFDSLRPEEDHPDPSSRGLWLVVPGGEGLAALLRPGQAGQVILPAAQLIDGHVVGQGIPLAPRHILFPGQLAGLDGGEGTDPGGAGGIPHHLDGPAGHRIPGAGAGDGVRLAAQVELIGVGLVAVLPLLLEAVDDALILEVEGDVILTHILNLCIVCM